MSISEEKIREFVEKLVHKHGEEYTKNYISSGDYPREVQEFALSLIEKDKPKEELMAENGDLSDFGL